MYFSYLYYIFSIQSPIILIGDYYFHFLPNLLHNLKINDIMYVRYFQKRSSINIIGDL